MAWDLMQFLFTPYFGATYLSSSDPVGVQKAKLRAMAALTGPDTSEAALKELKVGLYTVSR
jgi:hypothetical protein